LQNEPGACFVSIISVYNGMERLDRITSLIERLVTTVQTLAEVSHERMKALADSQQHSDDRLNAMIDYFQRHLEEHGKQQ
jgi:hypothetical protein